MAKVLVELISDCHGLFGITMDGKNRKKIPLGIPVSRSFDYFKEENFDRKLATLLVSSPGFLYYDKDESYRIDIRTQVQPYLLFQERKTKR
jgi:hypothetical protein